MERAPAGRGSLVREGDLWALGVAVVTLLALALRLVDIRPVPLDPYYDAAVRSMGLSWHNFFYGAFDPGGRVAIDKPPLDLWLQVLGVKLLGFKPLALKLPGILAASFAVPLLYDAVRRMFVPAARLGRSAGLLAALALAVMPVSVLTSRSDTMDSLMMALLVLAAWLIVLSSAGPRPRPRLLLLAAVVLGLAFNVKLLEILVALPALALLAWLLPGAGVAAGARPGRSEAPVSEPPGSAPARLERPGRHWRGARLALAGVVFVASALSWMTIVSLTPHRDRPYALGSTNGSVWNAVFVFNGVERLTQRAHPNSYGGLGEGSVRSHSGPLRLFDFRGLDYGGLIGTLLLGALLFGGLALWLWRPALVARAGPGRPRTVTRAGAGVAVLGVWLLTGYLLFSFAGRLHPRYLEAFTPAVAAALGAGLAPLVLALARRYSSRAVVGEGESPRGRQAWWRAAGRWAGEGARGRQAWWRAAGRWVGVRPRGREGRWGIALAITLVAALAVFAVPLVRDLRLIRAHASDEALAPSFGAPLVTRVSAFLRAHQGGAHFEFAASAPTLAAPVIVRDARPMLLLTAVNAHPLLTVAQLRGYAAAGEVRYLLSRGRCPIRHNPQLPACSPLVVWAKAHGRDITAQLHYPGLHSGLLYEITPPAA